VGIVEESDAGMGLQTRDDLQSSSMPLSSSFFWLSACEVLVVVGGPAVIISGAVFGYSVANTCENSYRELSCCSASSNRELPFSVASSGYGIARLAFLVARLNWAQQSTSSSARLFLQLRGTVLRPLARVMPVSSPDIKAGSRVCLKLVRHHPAKIDASG
jgi:hypothetical protein